MVQLSDVTRDQIGDRLAGTATRSVFQFVAPKGRFVRHGDFAMLLIATHDAIATTRPSRVASVYAIVRSSCWLRCANSRHFGGNIAMASTSNNAPGRASCGTPTVVLAGGETVFTYLSRTSR